MPFSNIYKSSSKHAINDLVKDMDLSLWKSMLNNIAEVLNAPAVELVLTAEVGFQSIAMSTSSGVKANPGKIIPKDINLYCKKVMDTRAMLYVHNATGQEEWSDNPKLTQMGYVSYLGLPIFHSDGSMFATLCALDTKETSYQTVQINLMESIRALLEREVHTAERVRNLKFTSIHDELTQVFNRRGVLNESPKIIDSASEYGLAIGFIYFDIDGLKYINDNFGHNIGDQYIKCFSNSLKKNTRKEDICGRIGGDEFVLLCRDVSETSLEQIVTRVKSDFDKYFNNLRINSRADFSQGTLIYSSNPPPIHELIKLADIKMYENKMTKRCAKFK
ncbi:sensor domain-containing diguanylate cyclase [Vibrio kanaloae]|uniref:sensor domain-containing diguanylate cyclase n=1 Tax=Vibrio kanaloae TaxID=170673 RepID=UPI0010BEF598|nr:sensor domain-containing diguanylate cyclase [Vibrio kanaloae]TKE95996.1 sensor domain-containing diguanylate cyclase [Vibrio kanaloae]TKF14161.1 sensor domain-containing diguanylate cyclase [Vibrio kanaloae]